MRKTTLIVVSAVVVLLAIGIGLTKRLTGSWVPPSGTGLPSLTPGRGVELKFSDKPVPLPAYSLTDLDGKPVTAESGRGKVVLVNFWATWCGPCREEIPALVALQEHYRDHLLIVGLSIDTVPPAEVRTFIKGFNLNYPVAIAPEPLIDAFGGVPSIPATFVVDPTGRIVQRHIGMIHPIITEHEVRALAGLPTEAKVTYVKDTGQVLLSNAAYATEIPGVDFTGLTPRQKEDALKRMNVEHCTCGCGLTVAQCRINDPSCTVSPPIAEKIVTDARKGGL